MKRRLAMYNFLTVVFAILAFVSVGSLAARSDMFTCAVLVVLFAHLTYTCYNKENEIRAAIRRKRRARKAMGRLTVVRGAKRTGRRVA